MEPTQVSAGDGIWTINGEGRIDYPPACLHYCNFWTFADINTICFASDMWINVLHVCLAAYITWPPTKSPEMEKNTEYIIATL